MIKMDSDIFDLIKKANETTLKKHGDEISLERAIFLSWWCDKGDCAFCYMSTQKDKIKDPTKARRNVHNIYAEAEMCKRLNWNIEFLSGGYKSFTTARNSNHHQKHHGRQCLVKYRNYRRTRRIWLRNKRNYRSC